MRKRQTNNNVLTLQKQILKKSAWDFFGASLLMVLFAVIFVVFWVFDQVKLDNLCLADFIILSIVAVLMTAAIRRFSILRKINKIEFSSEQTVLVKCKKLSFLYSPISRGTSYILCVVMTDESGKKFYYVFTKENILFDNMKKEIKAEILGKSLKLTCYRDTNIVKFSPLQ